MTTTIPDTYTRTQAWQTRAVCRDLDPDLFDLPGSGAEFPDEDRHRDQIREAKAACATCPVRRQCLDAALAVPRAQDMWAIAGGKTPRERAAIRRRRKPSRAGGRS